MRVNERIERRVMQAAEHIALTGATVRQTARLLGVSKSTVHKDMETRLKAMSPALYREVMQVFATENREELFSKRKSMETTHGTLGFRTGQPKLKTKKGFTWAAVLELLKKFGKDYVRTVEEPAKDKLLANRDNEECQQLMEDCGILVAQDETFYVEPKKEKED